MTQKELICCCHKAHYHRMPMDRLVFEAAEAAWRELAPDWKKYHSLCPAHGMMHQGDEGDLIGEVGKEG